MKVEDKIGSAGARTRRADVRSLIGGATNFVRLVRDRHQRQPRLSLYSLRPELVAEYSVYNPRTLKFEVTSHSVLMSKPHAPSTQR